ncbi:unnamed protein product [Parascedosporium putredinis]|uniref:Annexin n=1 Tax=Parascedosporium putredinis TaxID=1442378 RepID=A0A9P1H2I2_9PEZI|nr:unnamed protein product [Parascedosporium putredinis]CAI7994071.1 unnamed protein product [Parascedosporium putredinis]
MSAALFVSAVKVAQDHRALPTSRNTKEGGLYSIHPFYGRLNESPTVSPPRSAMSYQQPPYGQQPPQGYGAPPRRALHLPDILRRRRTRAPSISTRPRANPRVKARILRSLHSNSRHTPDTAPRQLSSSQASTKILSTRRAQYGQPPQHNAPYGQPPPPQGQYGAPPPAQYGQPPAGYGQPPHQGYPRSSTSNNNNHIPPKASNGSSLPATTATLRRRIRRRRSPAQPTPASQGYDQAQKSWAQPVNTTNDVEALRKAMKGMGCDEKALIRVFASPQYANPWAMQQLSRDYNTRFMRSLEEDIKSETRSGLETALLAVLRGPLANDVYVLDKSLNRMGTDEEALMDVMLSRSNADVRAIAAEYRRVKGKDLIVDIKEDVDDNLARMYSMILAGTRAEDAAPVLPHEIDQSSNAAQIHAIADAYRRKYHRGLEDVIEKEFRGDMEDSLLRMLSTGQDRARADAVRLREALTKRKDKLFINRVASLYWDRPRLDAAKEAYRKRYGVALAKEVKDQLKGDLEDVMLALLGERW